MTTINNLEQQADKLWEQYWLNSSISRQISTKHELFWQAYDDLTIRAQQNINLVAYQKDISQTHTNLKQKQLPSFRFSHVLKRAPQTRIFYEKKALMRYLNFFSLVALLVPMLFWVIIYDKTTPELRNFIMVIIAVFSGVGLLVFVDYWGVRQLVHTNLRIFSDKLIRKGKRLTTRSIKLRNITNLDFDDLGMIIHYYTIDHLGVKTREHMTVPYVIVHYQDVRDYLQKVIRQNIQEPG